MSIKHRVKDRAEDGKMRGLWMAEADVLSREYHERRYLYVDYGKNPAWFNRMFNNRPKRKEARAICRAIVTGDKAADVAMFPLEMKPCYYYW